MTDQLGPHAQGLLNTTRKAALRLVLDELLRSPASGGDLNAAAQGGIRKVGFSDLNDALAAAKAAGLILFDGERFFLTDAGQRVQAGLAGTVGSG